MNNRINPKRMAHEIAFLERIYITCSPLIVENPELIQNKAILTTLFAELSILIFTDGSEKVIEDKFDACKKIQREIRSNLISVLDEQVKIFENYNIPSTTTEALNKAITQANELVGQYLDILQDDYKQFKKFGDLFVDVYIKIYSQLIALQEEYTPAISMVPEPPPIQRSSRSGKGSKSSKRTPKHSPTAPASTSSSSSSSSSSNSSSTHQYLYTQLTNQQTISTKAKNTKTGNVVTNTATDTALVIYEASDANRAFTSRDGDNMTLTFIKEETDSAINKELVREKSQPIYQKNNP
jgi:hypothetical protein